MQLIGIADGHAFTIHPLVDLPCVAHHCCVHAHAVVLDDGPECLLWAAALAVASLANIVMSPAALPLAAEPRYARLDLLAKTLSWRHLAPTAPDTLTCYPFSDDDPFVLQQCPHILFAGNQQQFETRLLEGRKGRVVMAVGGERGLWYVWHHAIPNL